MGNRHFGFRYNREHSCFTNTSYFICVQISFTLTKQGVFVIRLRRIFPFSCLHVQHSVVRVNVHIWSKVKIVN